MKLKKGDTVIVIAGKDLGKKAAIVRVFPRENKVLLDGINVVKRHSRRTTAAGKGQIVEKALPIHASNVQLADPKTGKPTRIKIERTEKGGRERVAIKSGQKIK
jgi:large subunit ribosomal protein L24